MRGMDTSYTCECCGGHINRQTMVCEYCGTRYKKENNEIIRIETFTNPVRTFTAKFAIDHNIIIDYGPEQASEIAIKELANELSKCIAPMMSVYSEFDIDHYRHIIAGQIKIVEPVHTGGLFK